MATKPPNVISADAVDTGHHASPLLHEKLSNEQIVDYCSNPPLAAQKAIPLGGYGNKVIPMSSGAVVKYGPGVKIEEFLNLQEAHRLLDPSILRVPQPFRFFQNGEYGYLLMEHINGTVRTYIDDALRINKIGKALSHLATFQKQEPGPLGGGLSRGILWSEGTTTEYSIDGSVGRLEHWFNRRIEHEGLSLSFQECSFVLCHLDIAPRNIIWFDDDCLCIVDWASAGFYPRVFEWCLLDVLRGKNGHFQSFVKTTMEPLTDWEVKSSQLIIKAWGNSVRFH